jgi:hypothetical protein
MCSSLTFLSHMDSTFFFLFVSFGRFQQKNYTSMWRHCGSRIVGIFSRPFNEVLSSIIDILWWYQFFFYGKLCPICFSKELGFGGSVFMF